MDCQEVREKYSDYVDCCLGECQGAVEEHLAECLDCKNEVHGLKLIVSKLGCLPQESPPPDFLVKLNNRIDELDKPWFERLFGAFAGTFNQKALASVAMASMLVLGVVYATWNESPDFGAKPVAVAPKSPELAAVATPRPTHVAAQPSIGQPGSPIVPVSLGSTHSSSPRAPIPSSDNIPNLINIAGEHSAASKVPYVDKIIMIHTMDPEVVSEQVRMAATAISAAYLDYSGNVVFVRTSLETSDIFVQTLESLGEIEIVTGPLDRLGQSIIYQVVVLPRE